MPKAAKQGDATNPPNTAWTWRSIPRPVRSAALEKADSLISFSACSTSSVCCTSMARTMAWVYPPGGYPAPAPCPGVEIECVSYRKVDREVVPPPTGRRRADDLEAQCFPHRGPFLGVACRAALEGFRPAGLAALVLYRWKPRGKGRTRQDREARSPRPWRPRVLAPAHIQCSSGELYSHRSDRMPPSQSALGSLSVLRRSPWSEPSGSQTRIWLRRREVWLKILEARTIRMHTGQMWSPRRLWRRARRLFLSDLNVWADNLRSVKPPPDIRASCVWRAACPSQTRTITAAVLITTPSAVIVTRLRIAQVVKYPFHQLLKSHRGLIHRIRADPSRSDLRPSRGSTTRMFLRKTGRQLLPLRCCPSALQLPPQTGSPSRSETG